MRSTRYTSGGSTGGGGDTPDIVWADQLKQRDALGQVVTKLPDTPRFRDAPKLNPVLSDSAKYLDARVSTADVVATKPENLKLRDQASKINPQSMAVGRSGTPDADPSGDFFGVRALPTVTHGNENLQAQGATVPGVSNNEIEAFMKWDLRKFVGLTVRPGGFSVFRFFASNNALISNTITVETFTNGTTDPFTESTANWNSRPTAGTLVVSQTTSVPPTTAAQVALPAYTDAQVTAMLDKYVYWRFTGGPLTLQALFTITSRDSATNRPELTLDLQRA